MAEPRGRTYAEHAARRRALEELRAKALRDRLRRHPEDVEIGEARLVHQVDGGEIEERRTDEPGAHVDVEVGRARLEPGVEIGDAEIEPEQYAYRERRGRR